MRHQTLVEMAERDGIRLPSALREDWPPVLSVADEKGWFRFQRLYDVARSVLRTEDDVRRLVLEAAEDDVADGCGWTEIQVDPSGYAARFGGLTAVHRPGPGRGRLGRARDRPRDGGRDRRQPHPAPAGCPDLARLAAQYAGRGVVGFGLSNDERRGSTDEFAPAFEIARRAGLMSVPHGGELSTERIRWTRSSRPTGTSRPGRRSEMSSSPSIIPTSA